MAALVTDPKPMPLELLGSALGTCIAYYVPQFLQVLGLRTTAPRRLFA